MKIIIIGAGAAGYFAAIHAALEGAEVLLLEKSNKVLAKVKVSGGGRCNVTNTCDDPALLVKNYPRGSKELRGPFSRFHTQHTIDWFESRGVKLIAEHDGRMFPVTDSSQTIIDCLEKAAAQSRVQVRLKVAVEEFKIVQDHFELQTSEGVLSADRVVVATGGSPSPASYKWLSDLGFNIIPPVPSLFTFNMPNSPFLDLMGVSVPFVRVKIAGTNFTQDGPLLFTHWGISGPAVLKLSAWAARWLNEQQYRFSVVVNLVPELKENQVMEQIQQVKLSESGRKIISSRMFNLPVRLWENLCLLSGAGEHMKWAEVGKSVINKLVGNISGLTLQVSGKTTFKEEFVTCGGINLKEIDMQTMQSKNIPGLFFAGEVLDIDGVTGGFNFQAAWTTGFIAGNHAAME